MNNDLGASMFSNCGDSPRPTPQKLTPPLDRLVTIKIRPYHRNYREAALLLKKLSSSGKVGFCHIAPDVFDLAGMVHSFSTIGADPHVSPLTKLRVYAGERVKVGDTVINCKDLVDRAPEWEGDHGMPPRQIDELIRQCATDAYSKAQSIESSSACVSGREFLDKLILHLEKTAVESSSRKLLNFVRGELEKWRLERARRLMLRSMLEDFDSACQQVFERYMAAVGKLFDTHVHRIPAQPLVGQIENAAKWPAPIRTNLRMQLLVDYRHAQRHQPYTFNDSTIAEGIERFVERNIIDSMSLGDQTGNAKLFEQLQQRLLNRGYCPVCLEKLLQETEQPLPLTGK